MADFLFWVQYPFNMQSETARRVCVFLINVSFDEIVAYTVLFL